MLRNIGIVAALCLAGCGGGGGGGQVSMALSPSSLTLSYLPNQLPAPTQLLAKLGGNVGNAYVSVTDSGDGFAATQVNINNDGNNTFTVYLNTASDLHIGVHTGTLTGRVCRDQNCNSIVAAASLPYTLTIQPPSITAWPAAPNASALQGSVVVIPGTILSGEKSAPFASVTDDDNSFVNGAIVQMSRTLDGSSYQASLPVLSDASAYKHSGNINLTICQDANCQYVFGSTKLAYTAQVLRLVAGQAGVAGTVDGTGPAATFSNPGVLAVDSAGDVYVNDSSQTYDIRKISPAGEVSTVHVVGPVEEGSYFDGAPNGLMVDAAGNIYFSDISIPAIEKLAPDGTLSTIASTYAMALAMDAAGNIYGSQNYQDIFKISANGQIQYLSIGYSAPAMALDSSQNVYAATQYFSGSAISSGDSSDGYLDKLDKNGNVTELLSNSNYAPYQMTAGSPGNLLGTNTSSVYTIATSDGTVTTVVPPGATLSDESIFRPYGIVQANDGSVFIGDLFNNVILETNLNSAPPQ